MKSNNFKICLALSIWPRIDTMKSLKLFIVKQNLTNNFEKTKHLFLILIKAILLLKTFNIKLYIGIKIN